MITLIAFIATVLGSMSGAGSGLLLVPIWLLFGYPLPVAIATQQLAGIFWAPVAARNYLKDKPVEKPLLCLMTLTGLAGVLLGATIVLRFDQAVMKRCIGSIILLLIGILYFRKGFGLTRVAPRISQKLTALFALPLGCYEGFFGSGNGLFTSLLLVRYRGFDLPTALGHYYIVATVWCIGAVAIFFSHGIGDRSLMAQATVGCVLGAAVGSAIGSRKGPRFVRKVFMILGSVLALKLVIGY